MKDSIAAVLSTALACAAFLFLFLFLHWNPAVAAVLSVLLYFAFGLLLKPRKKLGGIDIEKIQGGEELQRLLDEARKDLKQIGKAARAITNIKAREDAEALEACGKRILGVSAGKSGENQHGAPVLYLLSGYGGGASGALYPDAGDRASHAGDLGGYDEDGQDAAGSE